VKKKSRRKEVSKQMHGIEPRPGRNPNQAPSKPSWFSWNKRTGRPGLGSFRKEPRSRKPDDRTARDVKPKNPRGEDCRGHRGQEEKNQGQILVGYYIYWENNW